MELLSALELSKYYPQTDTLANDALSLGLVGGELHAIVGENGAGKSTFARIAAGLERQDSGQVLVKGRSLLPGDLRDAELAGIGYVPQVSLMAPSLSIAENMALGREPRTLGLFVSKRDMHRQAELVMKRFGLDLDPATSVASLSVAERRQAEIALALARGGDILILDEPTSVLSEAEAESLFAQLRSIANTGAAIAFITHRVSEVMAFADSVTVLRQGRAVASLPIREADASSISALMSHNAIDQGAHEDSCVDLGSQGLLSRIAMLELQLGAAGDPLTLEVRKGEILAVVAFAGNGLSRLESMACGMEKAEKGRILIDGEDIASIDRARLRTETLAYLPSDREGRGLCLSASIRDNLVALRRGGYSWLDWIGSDKRNSDAEILSKSFGLECDMRSPASSLSGGNRQRLMFAREFDSPRKALILAEPLQGLDTVSRRDAISRIRSAAGCGAAALVLTSSVEDALDLADRVVALYRGRAVYEARALQAETRKLLACMAGSTEAA